MPFRERLRSFVKGEPYVSEQSIRETNAQISRHGRAGDLPNSRPRYDSNDYHGPDNFMKEHRQYEGVLGRYDMEFVQPPATTRDTSNTSGEGRALRETLREPRRERLYPTQTEAVKDDSVSGFSKGSGGGGIGKLRRKSSKHSQAGLKAARTAPPPPPPSPPPSPAQATDPLAAAAAKHALYDRGESSLGRDVKSEEEEEKHLDNYLDLNEQAVDDPQETSEQQNVDEQLRQSALGTKVATAANRLGVSQDGVVQDEQAIRESAGTEMDEDGEQDDSEGNKLVTLNGILQDEQAIRESMNTAVDDTDRQVNTQSGIYAEIPAHKMEFNYDERGSRSGNRTEPHIKEKTLEGGRTKSEDYIPSAAYPEARSLGRKRNTSTDASRTSNTRKESKFPIEDIVSPAQGHDALSTKVSDNRIGSTEESKRTKREDLKDSSLTMDQTGIGRTSPLTNRPTQPEQYQSISGKHTEYLRDTNDADSGCGYVPDEIAAADVDYHQHQEHEQEQEQMQPQEAIFQSSGERPVLYAPKPVSSENTLASGNTPQRHRSIALGGRSSVVLNSATHYTRQEKVDYQSDSVYYVEPPKPSLMAPVMGVEDEGDYYASDPARAGVFLNSGGIL